MINAITKDIKTIDGSNFNPNYLIRGLINGFNDELIYSRIKDLERYDEYYARVYGPLRYINTDLEELCEYDLYREVIHLKYRFSLDTLHFNVENSCNRVLMTKDKYKFIRDNFNLKILIIFKYSKSSNVNLRNMGKGELGTRFVTSEDRYITIEKAFIYDNNAKKLFYQLK